MSVLVTARVKGWVAGLVLTKGTAISVEALSEHFRVIRIGTRGQARPGDKVQVDVGGLVMRTYSPFSIDADGFSLLAFVHGATPGSSWAAALRSGDTVSFLGPRSSGATREPATVFGDETSIAVAASLGVRAVIESGRVEEAQHVATRLGVDAFVVERLADESHVGEVTSRLREIGAPIVLTGRSRAIVEVRKRLRAHGLDPRAKAYWDPSKKGLD